MSENGWHEYKKLFDYLIGKVDSIDDKVGKTLIEVAKLKEKTRNTAALYGTLGGGIGVLVIFSLKVLAQ